MKKGVLKEGETIDVVRSTEIRGHMADFYPRV